MTRPRLDETETGYASGPATLVAMRFERAMNFHYPEALAAVRDASGAYHINEDGSPAYARRFQDTAGFYEGLASVRAPRGYLHVRPDGSDAHPRTFRWLGNFQDGLCVALSPRGFHHVTHAGTDAYAERYTYAGDFRDGVAVVRQGDEAFHLRADGRPLHPHRFVDAQPYHKGVAVVRDGRGYFHVDRAGQPLHAHRFASAEPFYNGYALCVGHDGGLVRLRPNGTWCDVRHGLAVADPGYVRAALEGGQRVALVVRHAERHAIDPQDPNWGNGVLLTDRGVAHATDFGARLRGPWSLALYASTVERCRQTAASIGAGFGLSDIDVAQRDELACAPFFDATDDHKPHMRDDYHGLMTRYLGDGVAPGMTPVNAACAAVLDLVRLGLAEAPLSVMVSHDLACAVLSDHLGLKGAVADDWCDYLEGVCVIGAGDELTFARFVDAEATT